MKFSTILPIVILGFAAAAPVAEPQDIDFDAYDAVPIEDDIAAPVGAIATSVVTYNPTEAASVAVAAATGGSDPDLTKRTACVANAPGNYPTVEPDTPEAFLANPDFAAIANAATAPPGYFLSSGFKNLQASAKNPTYLTFVSSPLSSYDTAKCGALCTAMSGCNSFNIYFERDPAVDVRSTCPTTTGITRIKCAFFGSAITVADATNVGQYQQTFHIVIAGSNTYTLTPQPIDGYTGPVYLGNATIFAPTADGTYMGQQTFPSTQPYDPSVCAAACNEKSAYNLRHATPGTPARICRFFDAYILSKNGANGIFTCSYYTKAYDPSYATNFGQYNKAGDHYTPGHSYTYTVEEGTISK